MLPHIVNVSADNFITITGPAVLEQYDTIPTISKLISTNMETAYFNRLSEVAYFHLHLAHYRNQLLHLFIEDALLAVCLTDSMMKYGTA